jgi:hypothetical protein
VQRETEQDRPAVYTLPAALLFAIISSTGSLAHADTMTGDHAAMELGRKVLAVRQALQSPGEANAMQAVTDLGHDQRYYVMVRGWLTFQLEGDRSILAAAGEQAPHEVRERIIFLEKAIRAIDLE